MRRQRVLVAAVGLTWLMGSLTPSLLTLHQGVLLLALASFPTGQVRVPVTVALAVPAALIGIGVIPQPGSCVAFVLVATWAALPPAGPTVPRSPIGRLYPAISAYAVGLSLLLIWLGVMSSGLSVTAYSIVLVVVALCHLPAARWVSRAPLRSVDRLLGSSQSSVAPLIKVLADLLSDPLLQIQEATNPADPPTSSDLAHPVIDSGRIIAFVTTTSESMTDPKTRRSVLEAVRLVVTNERLQQQQIRLIAELDESRRQLLAALDAEREGMSTALQQSVLPRLLEADTRLATVHPVNPELAELIATSRSELTVAADLVQRIVANVPLGSPDEGLADALHTLASASPVPVTTMIAADACCGEGGEKAIRYACSEALTNVAKHAGASAITLTLNTVGESVELRVSDDGDGGADPHGHGLTGLADRLSAAGGTLQVHTSSSGTEIIATVPSAPTDQPAPTDQR